MQGQRNTGGESKLNITTETEKHTRKSYLNAEYDGSGSTWVNEMSCGSVGEIGPDPDYRSPVVVETELGHADGFPLDERPNTSYPHSHPAGHTLRVCMLDPSPHCTHRQEMVTRD